MAVLRKRSKSSRIRSFGLEKVSRAAEGTDIYDRKILYSQLFAKNWDPFFTNTRVEERSVYKDLVDAGGDLRNYFLDCEDSVSDCLVEEVLAFVEDPLLLNHLAGNSCITTRRAAWIDDRTTNTSKSQEGVPIGVVDERDIGEAAPESVCFDFGLKSARELYQYMKKLRFHPNMPLEYRRLLFIQDLDPAYALALIENVEFEQISILRDALWNYLAFQASLRTEISVGFTMFQMQIHLSFFELRSHPRKIESVFPPNNRQVRRQWIDLSFLGSVIKDSPVRPKLVGLEGAQFSFVLQGSCHNRWFVVCVADSLEDDDELSDLVTGIESQHSPDPISAGEIDANLPIWDPREYFLKILRCQSGRQLAKWTKVVRNLETWITKHKEHNLATLSKKSSVQGTQAEDPKITLDKTQQLMGVINQLLEVLIAAINEWEDFRSPKGDIGYFLDMETVSQQRKSDIRASVQSITKNMEYMARLKYKLQRLEKDGQNSVRALRLRLSVEGTEAMLTNGKFTYFNVSIVAPVMAAFGLYSVREELAPIKLHPEYFIPAVLSLILMVQFAFWVTQMLPGHLLWKWSAGWRRRISIEAINYGNHFTARIQGLVWRRGVDDDINTLEEDRGTV